MTTDPFRPDPRLFPFESRWFESRVGRIHYIDEGSGRPVLLLHGNPTWSFLYRGIVIRLRKAFRCIAPDYPGFGLSAHPRLYEYTPAEHAAVITDLVRALDLTDLTIMGQDWGGPIGLRVALDERQRIHALVMGNTWYWPADRWHLKTFSAVMSSRPVQGLIIRRNFFVERVMPTAVRHPLALEVLDHYRGPFLSPGSLLGVAEFPRQIIRSGGWLQDIAEAIPETLRTVPLLLTWGMRDALFTPSLMSRFQQDFESVEVVGLDAKHYIQEDAPAEISSAIVRFLGALATQEREE